MKKIKSKKDIIEFINSDFECDCCGGQLVAGDNENSGYDGEYYFEFECDDCGCLVTVSGDAARYEYKDSNDKWVTIPDSMNCEDYMDNVDPDASVEYNDSDCMEYDDDSNEFVYEITWSNDMVTRIVFDNVVITVDSDDDDDE